jgi:hypothetical protein
MATRSRFLSTAGGVGERRVIEWLYSITSDATIELSRAHANSPTPPAGWLSKTVNAAGGDEDVSNSINARSFTQASRSFQRPCVALMMSSKLRFARSTIMPPVPSTLPDRMTSLRVTSGSAFNHSISAQSHHSCPIKGWVGECRVEMRTV